jgi:hypothetical protein
MFNFEDLPSALLRELRTRRRAIAASRTIPPAVKWSRRHPLLLSHVQFAADSQLKLGRNAQARSYNQRWKEQSTYSGNLSISRDLYLKVKILTRYPTPHLTVSPAKHQVANLTQMARIVVKNPYLQGKNSKKIAVLQ